MDDLISFFDRRNHTITVRGRVKIENNPNICPSMVLSFWMFVDARGRRLVEMGRHSRGHSPTTTVELVERWLANGENATEFAGIFGERHNATTLAMIEEVEREVIAINANNGYFVKHICEFFSRDAFLDVSMETQKFCKNKIPKQKKTHEIMNAKNVRQVAPASNS